MSAPNLRVRRANTDDLPRLKSLWATMRLAPDELEKRLTEFQVVEKGAGDFLGALGLQLLRSHAWLHSEAYTDFALADAAREMFWERVQTLAAHHGVFRLWTQEPAPFWVRWGFQPANSETLSHLPAEWKSSTGQWFTLRLKNEEALAVLEKELAAFREFEKQRTAQALGRARTMTTIITVIGFVLGIGLIGLALYLFVRHNPFLGPH